MRSIKQVMRHKRGAAVAEYGLIAAFVGAAVAVASLALGSAVTSAVEDSPACDNGQARC